MRSLILATVMTFGLMQPSWACRCLEASAESTAERAALIVVGRILEHAPLHDGDGEIAILGIEQHWKDVATERIPVATGTSCKMTWKTGQRYLLYLFKDDIGLYSTTRCDGNVPLSAAGERVKALDRLFPRPH